MLVVPRQPTVRLVYRRNWADHLGLALSVGTVLFALAQWGWASRRGKAASIPVVEPDACDPPAPPRRWGGMVPALTLAMLVALRLSAGRGRREAVDTSSLYERAERAYAAERFADAAEYTRIALARQPAAGARGELLSLRGESLLAAGQTGEAAEAFETLLNAAPRGPYAPQALYGAARARAALGEAEAARSHRERLLRDYPDTPWARRARAEGGERP
jgi:predicted Zn-dependent protease